MGSASSAAINSQLTNYAFGIAPTITNQDARFICPDVLAPSGQGQYKRYDNAQAFKIYKTARALGGPRTTVEYSADDPQFLCKPEGLQIPIDDDERDKAGDNLFRLQQGKTKTLITLAELSRADKIITLAMAIAAAGGVGVWSDEDNDPVDDIDQQIEKIGIECGMAPNRVYLPLGAWRIVKNHPNVRGMLGIDKSENMSVQRFASLLANPNIEIKVGTMSKDTALPGATSSKVALGAGSVLIFIGSDNMSDFDPSFMKNFTMRPGGPTAVKTWRSEDRVSDMLSVDWSENPIVTGTICAARIAIS